MCKNYIQLDRLKKLKGQRVKTQKKFLKNAIK